MSVLKDIDFKVDTGDVTCIIGASGSGKSTLLRCINLLETPTNGEILFHGKPITGRDFNQSAYRAKVGMVFQSFNLFNNMTVLENCMVGVTKVLKRSKDDARELAIVLFGKSWNGSVYKRQTEAAFRRTETACGYCPRPCYAAGGNTL